MIGVADLINSMAAVKNLVYDTEQISMKDLVLALNADFAGYDAIKKLYDDAPKYGTDNEMTNEIAEEMFTFIANEIENYRSKFGTMTPGILSVSDNTPFGLEVGALPSGRHAWKPLADGVSLNGGTDTEETTKFLRKLKHVKDIELRPYHRLGLETYERLGRIYELRDIDPPARDALMEMAEIIRRNNPEITVKIKGELHSQKRTACVMICSDDKKEESI